MYVQFLVNRMARRAVDKSESAKARQIRLARQSVQNTYESVDQDSVTQGISALENTIMI